MQDLLSNKITNHNVLYYDFERFIGSLSFYLLYIFYSKLNKFFFITYIWFIDMNPNNFKYLKRICVGVVWMKVIADPKFYLNLTKLCNFNI